MVGVAQLVEHWLVVPVAAGSSPVIHPMSRSVPALADHGEAGTDVLSRPDLDLERDELTVADFSTPWLTIVWNDPVNLMAYVERVFRRYFGYPQGEAHRLMMLVHTEGRAVVASGPREEMERHVEAMHEYGLQATVAKDDA